MALSAMRDTPAKSDFIYDSYPVKGTTTIYQGGQTALVAGYAAPAGAIASHMVVGRAEETVDNSTGADGAKNVRVRAGIFKYANSADADLIAQADVGSFAYVVDDQTVAKTSSGGTRPRSGRIEGVDAGGVWILQGPWVLPAGDVTLTGSETLTNKTLVAPTIASAAGIAAFGHKGIIPLDPTSFLLIAGGPLAAFADGAYTVPGTTVADSKAVGVRWNNHAAPTAMARSVSIPADCNTAADMVLNIVCSKVGATIGDATTFTVGAFNQVIGALHDADTDFGGESSAVVGDATSKTVQKVTRTLALADLVANPSSFSLTIKPTGGKLGTDDIIIETMYIEYTKKVA